MRMRGEKGAALVTALMLTVLCLVLAMALLYTVTAGGRISASQKRYRSALSAARGGVDLVTLEIIPSLCRGELDTQLQDRFALIGLRLSGSDCLKEKLRNPTGNWSAVCAARAASDPARDPDLSFLLGAAGGADAGYQVTVKIVDTVPGNSDSGSMELLDLGGSVAGRDDTIHPQHVPSMFNISVQGVGGVPREKARLSLLYAY